MGQEQTTEATTTLPAHYLPNQQGFQNPWPNSAEQHGFWDFFKMSYYEGHRKKMADMQTKKHCLPLQKPNFTAPTDVNAIQTTWIGHSTFVIQTQQLAIITDPVFSNRASPVQFAGPHRLVPVPCQIKDLPKIDIVLVSHNHYDHLDYDACLQLYALHNPIFIVPLKLKEWFTSNIHVLASVIELDWYQSHQVLPNLKITGLPAHHWSIRTGMDRNQTLWDSYMLEFGASGKRIFFSCDTGYCPAFKEIGSKFQSIDLAFIPIGAYEPRSFHKLMHIWPEESVQIAQELNAKKCIGMHWGTFVLTAEPILEPRDKLKEELKKKNLDPSYFITMDHGQTLPNV